MKKLFLLTFFLSLALCRYASAQVFGQYGPAAGVQYNATGATPINTSAMPAQILPLTICSTNAQTGATYALVLADAFNCVTMNNAGVNTVNIPSNASVPFAIGTRITIEQIGAGVTSVAPNVGVTFNNGFVPALQVTTGTQFGEMTIRKTATDTWQIDNLNSTVPTYNSVLLNNGSIQSQPGNVGCQFTNGGDMFCTGSAFPIWGFQGTSTSTSAFNFINVTNDASQGPQFGVGPSTATPGGCSGNGSYAFVLSGPCEYLDSASTLPLVLAANFGTVAVFLPTVDLLAVGATPLVYLQANNTTGVVATKLGDATNASSTTLLQGLVEVPNAKRITFLDSAGLTTSAAYFQTDASNNLLGGVGGATWLTVASNMIPTFTQRIVAPQLVVSSGGVIGEGVNRPATGTVGLVSNGIMHASSNSVGTFTTVGATVVAGTKFTTTGCSISATTGGASAGTFTLGTNTCSVVITMNGATGSTAPTGWSCDAHDRTTPVDLIGGENSSTATTATITIPVTVGATDVISFSCVGF